ncbi:MAG: inorganic phosphate transporter [Burkholderiaceae bacterium]|nr:inorganic phosphate transporter [Burkholderiaceae bacterium]
MDQLVTDLTSLTGIMLITVFVLIVLQEAINGFHDAANAIATVIYANALTPMQAVTLSAVFNFLGVLIGGTAVAFSLVYLLPQELVAGINTRGEAALFAAMIVSAVIWNFGTWWLGIPNSTTHAYIGSIIGAAMADAFLHGQSVAGQINWLQGEKNHDRSDRFAYRWIPARIHLAQGTARHRQRPKHLHPSPRGPQAHQGHPCSANCRCCRRKHHARLQRWSEKHRTDDDCHVRTFPGNVWP